MRHFIPVLLLAIVMAGCATPGHREFYRSYPGLPPLSDVQLLKKDAAPDIYLSNNLERDIKILLAKGFLPIGESSFNGSLEGKDKVVSQAGRVGALVVLLNSTYTNTQINTGSLFSSNNSKIYGAGSFYGSGGFTSYRSPSTASGTAGVPGAPEQRRFDQTAVYFVKFRKIPGFGLVLVDLTPELQVSSQRNSGVLIDVVMEGSRAFHANVLPGDILIQVDGVDVRDMQHALALMKNAASANRESQLRVLRDSAEKTIRIQPDVNQ